MPMLADPNLRGSDLRVLISLISHVRPADGRLTCFPSNARISQQTALEVGNVRRILGRLEALRYIKRGSAVINGRSLRVVELTLPYEEWRVQGEIFEEGQGLSPPGYSGPRGARLRAGGARGSARSARAAPRAELTQGTNEPKKGPDPGPEVAPSGGARGQSAMDERIGRLEDALAGAGWPPPTAAETRNAYRRRLVGVLRAQKGLAADDAVSWLQWLANYIAGSFPPTLEDSIAAAGYLQGAARSDDLRSQWHCERDGMRRHAGCRHCRERFRSDLGPCSEHSGEVDSIIARKTEERANTLQRTLADVLAAAAAGGAE